MSPDPSRQRTPVQRFSISGGYAMLPKSRGLAGAMATKKKAKPAQPIEAPPPSVPVADKPWWKSTWLKITAGVTAVAVLLTNINSILASSRALPGEFGKTADQFSEWYGEYPAWKGYWTNFPEGFVDMAEMNLSKEDFRLNIDETKDGSISGTIETRGVCGKVPYFDQFLVDGSISSWRSAEIEIFDYVGGYRRDFARLKLKRDDEIMTVIPLDDPGGIFAKEARIARAPPDLIGSDGHEALCGDKRFKFISEALKKVQAEQSSGTTAK